MLNNERQIYFRVPADIGFRWGNRGLFLNKQSDFNLQLLRRCTDCEHSTKTIVVSNPFTAWNLKYSKLWGGTQHFNIKIKDTQFLQQVFILLEQIKNK